MEGEYYYKKFQMWICIKLICLITKPKTMEVEFIYSMGKKFISIKER